MINFGNSFNFNKIKIFIKNFYKTPRFKKILIYLFAWVYWQKITNI